MDDQYVEKPVAGPLESPLGGASGAPKYVRQPSPRLRCLPVFQHNLAYTVAFKYGHVFRPIYGLIQRISNQRVMVSGLMNTLVPPMEREHLSGPLAQVALAWECSKRVPDREEQVRLFPLAPLRYEKAGLDLLRLMDAFSLSSSAKPDARRVYRQRALS